MKYCRSIVCKEVTDQLCINTTLVAPKTNRTYLYHIIRIAFFNARFRPINDIITKCKVFRVRHFYF